MKVCVVGLGYIGLPAASLMATKGFDVVGVDVRPDVVETINKGEIHIFEPDLDVLVRSAVNSGKLKASLTPVSADVFIICVPTPFKEGHVPDLGYVEAATRSIAPFLAKSNLVILESTSPVGTTENIARWISEIRTDLGLAFGEGSSVVSSDVFIAHCPERVLPGHILRELVDNDRIVGGINAMSTEKACAFYRRFVKGDVLSTDSRTAEMAKLVENSFRDVNIAFANELSYICDQLRIDVWELIGLANRHPRVNILQPGPGVGGHCIAVDPWFIVDSAPENAKLIRAAREINDSKPGYVVDQILSHTAHLQKPVVACLGLSYKADIDDFRESPAMEVVEKLADKGSCRVLVVEPHLLELPRELKRYENVHLVDLNTAVTESSAVVLLVNHKAFYAVDRALLKDKVVFDTRGVWR